MGAPVFDAAFSHQFGSYSFFGQLIGGRREVDARTAQWRHLDAAMVAQSWRLASAAESEWHLANVLQQHLRNMVMPTDALCRLTIDPGAVSRVGSNVLIEDDRR